MKGGVHRAAQTLLNAGAIDPMVIAMPSDGLRLDGSAYLRFASNDDVERWIVDEVPAIARLAVPALGADARIAIAGLSMGGYGALRLGAKFADRFSSISAHSAITDIHQMRRFVAQPLNEYLSTTSDEEELDPFYWILKAGKDLPKLRFDCGEDDALLEGNRVLHRRLVAYGVSHAYEEYPGGHEWSYWAKHIQDTLHFVSEQ